MLTLAKISRRVDNLRNQLATIGDCVPNCRLGETMMMIRDLERQLTDFSHEVADAAAEEAQYDEEFSRGFEEAKEASLQRRYAETAGAAYHPGDDPDGGDDDPETTADDLAAAGDLANDEAGYEAQV